MSFLYDEFLSLDRLDGLPSDVVIFRYREIYFRELLACRSDFMRCFHEFEFLQSLLTVDGSSPLDSIVLTLESQLIDLRESYLRLLVVYKLLCEKTGVESDVDVCDISFLKNKEF